jgi:hypothetical protein
METQRHSNGAICGQNHDYIVENEAQETAFYVGTDRDTAIGVLVALRVDGECGYITARHPGGAPYCGEESIHAEDEAIAIWDKQTRAFSDAKAAQLTEREAG